MPSDDGRCDETIGDGTKMSKAGAICTGTQIVLVTVPSKSSRCKDILIIDEVWLGEVRTICIHTQLEIVAGATDGP